MLGSVEKHKLLRNAFGKLFDMLGECGGSEGDRVGGGAKVDKMVVSCI